MRIMQPMQLYMNCYIFSNSYYTILTNSILNNSLRNHHHKILINFLAHIICQKLSIQYNLSKENTFLLLYYLFD